MTHQHSSQPPVFDQFAVDYDTALDQGLAVSGEDREFFAQGRITWLASRLRELHEQPKSLLDFGCGTGASITSFFDLIGVESALGVDSSAQSLEVARQIVSPEQVRLFLLDQYQPSEQVDLAYCNGVFHHIAPSERAAAVQVVYRSLRPGGTFSFWENNPWNPGTRYIMSRIPFDRDAIPLSPREARRLLRNQGFEVLRTDFLFFFPRPLYWLRIFEPRLAWLPLGAQYQVLCRKLR